MYFKKRSSDLHVYISYINTCHSAWIRPQIHVIHHVALSYSELLMIIKSKDFYVLGHISNIIASLWAKTVMKLETILTRDGRLPVG